MSAPSIKRQRQDVQQQRSSLNAAWRAGDLKELNLALDSPGIHYRTVEREMFLILERLWEAPSPVLLECFKVNSFYLCILTLTLKLLN